MIVNGFNKCINQQAFSKINFKGITNNSTIPRKKKRFINGSYIPHKSKGRTKKPGLREKRNQHSSKYLSFNYFSTISPGYFHLIF